jgi:hypothetical protein
MRLRSRSDVYDRALRAYQSLVNKGATETVLPDVGRLDLDALGKTDDVCLLKIER